MRAATWSESGGGRRRRRVAMSRSMSHRALARGEDQLPPGDKPYRLSDLGALHRHGGRIEPLAQVVDHLAARTLEEPREVVR